MAKRRFDEMVFPSIEEVRERCLRDPAEIMGECQIPGSCVVAKVTQEKINDSDVRVNVYPASLVRGFASITWLDANEFLGLAEDFPTLPTEINNLALRFDAIGLPARGVTAREVVEICDRIITLRKVAA